MGWPRRPPRRSNRSLSGAFSMAEACDRLIAGQPRTPLHGPLAKADGEDLEPPDAHRDREIEARSTKIQLALMEGEDHPVIEELRRRDIQTLTPIEALTTLYQFQKQLNGSGK